MTRVSQLFSVEGEPQRPAPWIGPEGVVLGWSDDGRQAFVADGWQPPFRVARVDIASGRREPWLDTSPPDPTGITPGWAQAGTITPDGRHYVYSYGRTLGDLVLVEGLR